MEKKLTLILPLLLIFLVVFLWLMEKIKYSITGSYFGGGWTSFIILLIGLALCIIFIPIIYITTYKDCKNEDLSWKTLFSWIYPLFLIGIIFQLATESYYLLATIPLSLIVVFGLHIILFILSMIKEDRSAYFLHFTFLSLYYFFLVLFTMLF